MVTKRLSSCHDQSLGFVSGFPRLKVPKPVRQVVGIPDLLAASLAGNNPRSRR